MGEADALLLGIDLGGTKSAAVIGTPRGDIVFRVADRTPAQGGPDAVIPFLVRLARRALVQVGGRVAGVGVSAGAPADTRTNTVYSAPNLPGWGNAGIALGDLLSRALDGLPVRVENDANATALAEHRFGAGRGANDLAFLTLGTGIGAGLILQGRLHRGWSEAGGEVGHVAVEMDGRLCACGLRGCLEAYASGPSLVRVALERGYTGEPTGQAVLQAAREENAAATAAVEQAAQMLGRAIAVLCMIVNPERVVLGTLGVHGGDLLLPTIRETVRAQTWPRIHENLTIVPAALGDRAQDLAALCAWLAREPEEN